MLLISYEATRPTGLLRAAERAPHPHGGRRHVVVVADAPVAGDEVAAAIVNVAGPGAKRDVLAPTIVSHLHHVTSDDDAEAHAAALRLRTSLKWAAEHGFDARGEVGDDEPATAMADELRDFGADAVTERAGRRAEMVALQLRNLERAHSRIHGRLMGKR